MDLLDNNAHQIEVRKIQAIHGQTTFVLVIPKEFVERLKIAKGDYVKCTIADDSLVVKKAEL
jgi:bifunctional DNA-binding transcriptional regulator/antitoxin component of YhaV-PrlF toxin-antitoxin module